MDSKISTEIDNSSSTTSDEVPFDQFTNNISKANYCCMCKSYCDVIESDSFRKTFRVFCDLCYKGVMKNSKMKWMENINKVYGKCEVCYKTICFEQDFIVHDCTNTHFYSCKRCGILCFKNEDLMRHINKCNDIVLQNVEIKKNCLDFTVGNSNNSSKMNTKKHPSKFGKKPLIYKSQLISCVATQNSENPFACEYCNKSFSYKSSFLRHLHIHTGKKQYACQYCNKSFHQKSNLVNHIRIHTGEKPFACQYCNKSFSDKRSLVCHTHIHTGEKPFACQDCNKSFSNKSSFIRHLRIIHTREKQFVSVL